MHLTSIKAKKINEKKTKPDFILYGQFHAPSRKDFLFGMPAVSTYSMFKSIGSTKWANSSADLFCSLFATTKIC